MTTNMIEKVARAMMRLAQEQRNAVWDATNRPHLKRDPEAVSDGWQIFEREARAAIEAMKEPDADMLADGMDRYARHDDAEEDVDGIYRAMISAALKE
jgi:hypothetical protein